MPTSIRVMLVALLVVLSAPRSPGQEPVQRSTEAEKLFSRALHEFDAADYQRAAASFGELVRLYPTSHRVTAATVMRGKALYEIPDYLESARTLRGFLAAYPSSSYRADAHLTLGNVYERIGRPQEALREYQSAWRSTDAATPRNLATAIVASLDTLLGRASTPQMVRQLLNGAPLAAERAFYWVKIGEKEADLDNIVGAADAVDTLDRYYPAHPFAVRVDALRERLTGSANVRIAAVLPLMRKSEPSAAKAVASDVYDGIALALEGQSAMPAGRVTVGLESRDTERNPETARDVVRKLAADKSVIAVVGPIFSTTTSAAAAAAETEQIPLISPTANSNGIAASGPFVFQANPDYETRGRAMARFAVERRGCRVLATLAPEDTYGKFLADAFIREAELLGAKVVSVEWYRRKSTDLKSQLANIRRAAMLEASDPMVAFTKLKTPQVMRLLEYGIPKKRIDSLMAAGALVRGASLFGPTAAIVMDSLGIPVDFDESRLDSLQYPATGVQGLYVPISGPEEVGVVGAQFVYFNIQAQLFGSGEWNDEAALHEHKRYTSGLIFESDTYIDTSSATYREFASAFSARFRKYPSKNALFGFDTAQLLLHLIRNGAATRPALARALARTRDFQGIHSPIGFSEGRVNSWLSILQYDGTGVSRLGVMGLFPSGRGGEANPE